MLSSPCLQIPTSAVLTGGKILDQARGGELAQYPGVPFGWILKERMDSARREARPFVEPVFFSRMRFELLIICTCVKAAVFHLAISCSWVSRRNRRRKSTGIPQTPRDATAVMSASVGELYSIVYTMQAIVSLDNYVVKK